MISKTLQEDFDHTLSKLSVEEKKKLFGSTILVTGCGGFLGYYLMHFLQNKAKTLGLKKVIGLDNFMLGYPEWMDSIANDSLFDVHTFDIIKDKIQEINGADSVDYIVHMASVASPMFYRQYPIETIDANIWGLRSLLDYYVDKKIKGFLFYSSSESYGDPDDAHVPTSEDYCGQVSFTGPRACYDESKRFGETICMLYATKRNMPIGVVRPFNVYGPGIRINDKRVVADYALAVKEGKDIEILSNGTPTRTFCYVADTIAGDLKILLHGEYGYYNIGIDSPEITVAQLAEIYKEAGKEIYGYEGSIKYAVSDDEDYLTDNPQRRCPNIGKAKRELGYNPTIYVEEGVRRYLRFINESEEKEYKW